MPTLFSSIIDGEIPAAMVFTHDHWVGFLDIAPVSPGHVLVVPRHETALVSDVPAASLASLGGILAATDSAIRAVTNCDAVSILLRDGSAAGQEVPHVHWHLIPRFNGDQPHAFVGGQYADGAMNDMATSLEAAWTAP